MATSPHPKPPLRALRKLAKERLRALRQSAPETRLAAAQLLIAREQGFSSWRALHEELSAEEANAALPALLTAIRAGEVAAMRRLLRASPRLVDARTADGATALHHAVETDRAEVVDVLMLAGASLDARYGGAGHTPLSWASTYGAPRAAAALIAGGARSDLFCAAGLGMLEGVQAAFDRHGALKPGAATTGSSRWDVNGQPLPRPPTEEADIVADALYMACRHGHEAVARWLLGKQPNLAFRAYLGATPLHWAEFSGNERVCAALRAAGADPQVRDYDQRTPRAFGICVPASFGLLDRVRDQLARDPTLAHCDEGCNTPLHEAAAIGHVEMIALLLAHGADPQARDAQGRTPRDLTKLNGHGAAELALAAAGE